MREKRKGVFRTPLNWTVAFRTETSKFGKQWEGIAECFEIDKTDLEQDGQNSCDVHQCKTGVTTKTEKEKWKTPIEDEINSLNKNNSCIIVDTKEIVEKRIQRNQRIFRKKTR